jgi:hypothetical protein
VPPSLTLSLSPPLQAGLLPRSLPRREEEGLEKKKKKKQPKITKRDGGLKNERKERMK